MSLLSTIHSPRPAYGVEAYETNPPLRTEDSLHTYESQNSAKTIKHEHTQRNLLDLRCKLYGLPRQFLALLTAILLPFFVHALSAQEDVNTRTNTIEVRPFTNLSGQSADEWIGMGIAESLAADLLPIKRLRADSTLSVISTETGTAPTPLTVEGPTSRWSPGSTPPLLRDLLRARRPSPAPSWLFFLRAGAEMYHLWVLRNVTPLWI